MAYIFWFEDDTSGWLAPFVTALREHSTVEFGAGVDLVYKTRKIPINLVILDIMISHRGKDEIGQPVANLKFEDVSPNRTGVVLLERIRQGHFETWGFRTDVPVILCSAVADYLTLDKIRLLGISAHIPKPINAVDLISAVYEALNNRER